MKKILVLITALALVVSLAACGGKEEPATTAPEVTQGEAVSSDAQTTLAETESVTEETTAVETTAAETATYADTEMSKADFVKFLNEETGKIAENGKYALVRKCEYTKTVDIGSATDIINGIIKGIDKTQDLDSVIGLFLGMGTTQGNIPADEISDNYKIIATTLKESDLGSFSASDGTYKFTLEGVSNPKKTGATPFSRFTHDFVTEEEVISSIAEFTGAVKVKDSNVNYRNIKVEVKVADGKITSMKYSYDFDAMLAVTALVATIKGDGAAVNNVTYSDIVY